jgi:hypothetical protein
MRDIFRQNTTRRATVAQPREDIFRPNTTRRAKMARRKENSVGRDSTKDKVMLRSPKGGTFGKRLWKGPECNTGIRDRGLRQNLQGRYKVKDLGSRQPRYVKNPDLKKVQVKSTGNFDMNLTKAARMEIAKRIVGSSDNLRPDKDWNLWRGRPPPKQKKDGIAQRRNG